MQWGFLLFFQDKSPTQKEISFPVSLHSHCSPFSGKDECFSKWLSLILDLYFTVMLFRFYVSDGKGSEIERDWSAGRRLYPFITFLPHITSDLLNLQPTDSVEKQKPTSLPPSITQHLLWFSLSVFLLCLEHKYL